MKTLQQLEDELINTRIWDDNKTLDYELPDSDDTFVRQLVDFVCPRCDGSIIEGNEVILKGLPALVKGAALTCKTCKLPLFIHEPVQPT